MSEGQIQHQAVVKQIMSHAIRVSIVQETACAACAAANLCHSSESKEKLMDIACENAASYQVGQQVTLVGSIGLGLRATLWAYVVPLVLLMAVLVTVSRLTENEGLGAVVALLSLVPYCFFLYVFRTRLQRTFSFRIKS
ncbi:MAG: SoxR reducing system RseC family protein [Bacteroidaceae bacterium]|nr:SoxR reducing system RseC family protein [Bacteroidaceae bacterium]